MMWKGRVGAICMLAAIVFSAACKRDTGAGYREGDISIAYLKSLHVRESVAIKGDVYISGHVVSTDQYGNFFKTLFIEDDTGGIALRIDLENYHRAYYRGMKLRVACNGLVLSDYGGMLQLGAYSYDGGLPDLGYISANRLAAVITIGEGSDKSIEPLLINIEELAPHHIGRFVAFDGVQFAEGVTGMTWSEPDADSDRHITDRAGNLLVVRTSRYAEFAGRLLPLRSGYIEGVATCFNGNYQLVVCSDNSAVMDSPRF